MPARALQKEEHHGGSQAMKMGQADDLEAAATANPPLQARLSAETPCSIYDAASYPHLAPISHRLCLIDVCDDCRRLCLIDVRERRSPAWLQGGDLKIELMHCTRETTKSLADAVQTWIELHDNQHCTKCTSHIHHTMKRHEGGFPQHVHQRHDMSRRPAACTPKIMTRCTNKWAGNRLHAHRK